MAWIHLPVFVFIYKYLLYTEMGVYKMFLIIGFPFNMAIDGLQHCSHTEDCVQPWLEYFCHADMVPWCQKCDGICTGVPDVEPNCKQFCPSKFENSLSFNFNLHCPMMNFCQSSNPSILFLIF